MLPFTEMGRVSYIFTLVALFLPGLLGGTESKPPYTMKSYWLCKHKKDVRTVRVQVDQKGICFTFYTKNGVDQYIGSGRNHDRCLAFLENIKNKLEGSSWSCRDISDTKITENE
jgi:hypothetical protein